jgi:hypothetical protein
MKRRSFLRAGLWGGALLVVGGSTLQLWPTRRRHTPRQALHVLDEREFAILAQVAERMVALPDMDAHAIAHGIDETFWLGPPEVAADFKRLLGLVESGLAGLLLDGRAQNFTRLDAADQDRALLAFRDSGILARRAGYQALRKLCVAGYYASDKTWAGGGYPGPPQLQLPADYHPPD